MPKRDGKGPPNGAKGLRDGRGSGKGKEADLESGKGVGQRKGGKKGPCKKNSSP
jgi:hypothetical protein